MNILHLINDLSVGSIEKSLINYCINDKKNNFEEWNLLRNNCKKNIKNNFSLN